MKKVIHHAHRFLNNPAFGILLIRVMVGLVFLTHGWMKVQTMTHFIPFFASLGFPTFIAYFIAWLEVIGGLGLILGVGARFFGILFGIEMIVAALLVSLPHGFMAMGFELVLSAASFGIAFIGAGKYAVYRMKHD